jgi:hypothetical protein
MGRRGSAAGSSCEAASPIMTALSAATAPVLISRPNPGAEGRFPRLGARGRHRGAAPRRKVRAGRPVRLPAPCGYDRPPERSARRPRAPADAAWTRPPRPAGRAPMRRAGRLGPESWRTAHAIAICRAGWPPRLRSTSAPERAQRREGRLRPALCASAPRPPGGRTSPQPIERDPVLTLWLGPGAEGDQR